jgi:hypothetical protein
MAAAKDGKLLCDRDRPFDLKLTPPAGGEQAIQSQSTEGGLSMTGVSAAGAIECVPEGSGFR